MKVIMFWKDGERWFIEDEFCNITSDHSKAMQFNMHVKAQWFIQENCLEVINPMICGASPIFNPLAKTFKSCLS